MVAAYTQRTELTRGRIDETTLARALELEPLHVRTEDTMDRVST